MSIDPEIGFRGGRPDLKEECGATRGDRGGRVASMAISASARMATGFRPADGLCANTPAPISLGNQGRQRGRFGATERACPAGARWHVDHSRAREIV